MARTEVGPEGHAHFYAGPLWMACSMQRPAAWTLHYCAGPVDAGLELGGMTIICPAESRILTFGSHEE